MRVGYMALDAHQIEVAKLYIAAATALVTAALTFLVYRLQRHRDLETWYKEFRELHREFWSEDRSMLFARRSIANDEDYERLRPVLVKRLARRDGCSLSAAEYEVLDHIDRFCAVLARVKEFNPKRLSRAQRRLWDQVYYDYWFTAIASERRRELREYVDLTWRELITRHESRAAGRAESGHASPAKSPSTFGTPSASL